MRIERLDAQPGTEAALQVQDVWIDAATLGVRVASTARLPLARLAGGPGGFVVYGFRDGRNAHIVVPSASAMAFRDASGQTGTTTCGHIRLPLTAEPRSGSMALVMGAVRFPSKPRATAKHAELASPRVPEGTAASPLQATSTQPPAPPAAETRVVRVSASLSQTSQEREPVFSVALGWEDAEPQPTPVNPSLPPQRPANPQIDFERD
jgi:hypothetical protein